jgi:hypothetical protein
VLRPLDGFTPVGGFTNDLDPARLEQAAQPIAKQRMVVGDQHAQQPHP